MFLREREREREAYIKIKCLEYTFSIILRELLIEFIQSDGNLCRLSIQGTKNRIYSTFSINKQILLQIINLLRQTQTDIAWVRCKAPKCIVNYVLCKMYI